MATTYSNKSIVQEGLVFYVDAANPRSYVSGSNTIDNLYLPNNITGSLVTDISFSNNAWDFDGIDDRITVDGLSTLMSSSATTTYNVWVKPQNQPSTVNNIFNFGFNYYYPTIGLAYVPPENAPTTLTVNSGSYYILTGIVGGSSPDRWTLNTTGSIFQKEWTNICVTKTGGGNALNKFNCKIYVNGTEQDTILVESAATQDWWHDTLYNIFNPSETLNRFNVSAVYRQPSTPQPSPDVYNPNKISTISIYNRTLSSSEVLQNYNALKDRFI